MIWFIAKIGFPVILPHKDLLYLLLYIFGHVGIFNNLVDFVPINTKSGLEYRFIK